MHFFCNFFYDGFIFSKLFCLFSCLTFKWPNFLKRLQLLSLPRGRKCALNLPATSREKQCDTCFKVSALALCLCAVKETVKLVFLSPGMPSSGGHTVSVVAACGWWGEFSHSTPKEVFVSAGPKLPPWNRCLLREKQKRKESSLKTERRGGKYSSVFLVMFTAPSNVPWLVGKPSNCHLKDCFLFLSHFFFTSAPKKSVKCLIKNTDRDLFHSGSWSHLPLTIATTNATTIHQLGTARPSAGGPQDLQLGFRSFPK